MIFTNNITLQIIDIILLVLILLKLILIEHKIKKELQGKKYISIFDKSSKKLVKKMQDHFME